MTREQILSICRLTPDVGAVKHEEFADYIIAMRNRKKEGEQWVTVETPYMQVDGKVAMARLDHRRQQKKLDIHPITVLIDNEQSTTVLVAVDSEVYGKSCGVATSRKDQKNSKGELTAESEFYFETAETSALGRALSSLGYGLFAGSGLSSAEDMKRVTERQNPVSAPAASENKTTNNTATTTQPQRAKPERAHPPMSPVQKNKLVELWTNMNGQGDAVAGLNQMFQDSFKVNTDTATYEQAARLTGQLLAELRQKQGEAK